MDQQTYLNKFSRAVRWRLPASEADEVLADYKELFSQARSESQPLSTQEFGEPIRAAKLLSDPKSYHRWLGAFGVMAFCLLLFEFLLFRASFSRYPSVPVCALFLLGMAVSLIWFRPRPGEHRNSPLPRGLIPALLGLLILLAAAAVMMAGLMMQLWRSIPPALYGSMAHGTLLTAGTAAAIFGLLGAVKARLSDRRWGSLYVMGLTGSAVCVLVLALLLSPSLAVSSSWLTSYFYGWGLIGIVGLIGTGVSLC